MGDVEEEKKMNATYIISVARKLGCSIFILPEDLIEVILPDQLALYYYATSGALHIV